MKKLLINGLIVVVFVLVLVGLLMGLSQLRSVDETDSLVGTALQNDEDIRTNEWEILEESSVTVRVGGDNEVPQDKERTKESINPSSKKSTGDDDLDAFLNSLG